MFKRKNNKRLLLSVFVFCFTVQTYSSEMPDINIFNQNAPVFPHMLFTDVLNNWKRTENSKPYWVYTEEEMEARRLKASYQVSFLLNNDVLAYYGHPNSRNMGILGRYSIPELDERLSVVAAEYEAVSGGKKVHKAFYLIYGTVWPEGEIGIMSNATLMRYIEYGLENDIMVFIDHQIGKYDPIDSLRRMLPYLQYPNVHLALDPEWRTDKPMVVIGNITAEEINRAQQVMEDYMIANNIPGERFLVIHQFNARMINDRMNVRTNFNRVRLIHCMDGMGTPTMKLSTYAYNAQATNIPLKSFKLFYDWGIPGAGVDRPLMTPQEVYNLNPRPYIIMYQ